MARDTRPTWLGMDALHVRSDAKNVGRAQRADQPIRWRVVRALLRFPPGCLPHKMVGSVVHPTSLRAHSARYAGSQTLDPRLFVTCLDLF
jgi:hypothetical protein